MKLIKQSFQFVNQKGFTLKDIYKHIEYCARISYKSQDKITDTSYEKFVNMLKSRGHDRPLEFGTVHLKMESSKFQGFMQALYAEGIFNNIWIKFNYNERVMYITTNYRYYSDIIKRLPNIKEYLTEEDNEYYPKKYTVHMILDRGVMDEFRTHVGLSHLAESTRYCNYAKDKFGGEVTFIEPCWDIKTANEIITPEGTHKSSNSYEFLVALKEAEYHYLNLLAKGWTPQQARSVLPLGIKSELISCGFEDAWENFFKRRDASDAHPMAQEIAKPIHEKFNELIRVQ